MVKTDIRNDTKNRINDIGTVKTSSQARFQNDIIHFLPCKPVESHSCSDLKERHIQVIESIIPFLNEIPDILLRYQSSSITPHNPDALTEIKDVRRSIEPDLETLCSKNGSQHI